jgi:acyl-CoA synthetase (AMP-forming)/AMP-acid ligase II
MIIPDTIYNTVKLYGQKEAIICSEGRFTYHQFKEHIDRLSSALHESGIQKGDRVAVLHMNCHIFQELYYAAAQIGAILVPLNTRLSAKELAFMVKDSGSSFLFAEYRFIEKVRDIQQETDLIQRLVWTKTLSKDDIEDNEPTYEQFLDSARAERYEEKNIDPDDTAQIFYTSGTTGRPKGAIMTHKNMACHAMGTLWEYQVTDDDVWGHVAPLFHMSDICNGWAMTWAGAKQIFIDQFDTMRILDEIEREKFTLLKMVPTMWTMLLNDPTVHQRDFSSLRLVISGGAPIAPELIRKIMETFKCEYVQNYGMTEATHFLTISRLKDSLRCLPREDQIRYLAKTGRPFFGVKIRVIDENGQDVKPDGEQVGEIITKGDIITPGYWNLPEENEKAFQDGWLYTGDLATIDQEGYIHIVDRKKDMIVTGGENVYSVEVERILHYHPSLVECAVLGVPDPKWGEAVKAVCVVKVGRDVTEEDLISTCKEYLASYKAPKSIDFVAELPKTGSGKIDKKGLKENYWPHSERTISE